MMKDDPEEINKQPFAQRTASWVLLLVLGYLPCFFWLQSVALVVPAVLISAPYGLLKLFAPVLEISPNREDDYVLLIHRVFWPVYLSGLLGAPHFNRRYLEIIFMIVTLAIILTWVGCASHYSLNWKDVH